MLIQTAFDSILLTKVAVLMRQVKLTTESGSEDILVRVLVRDITTPSSCYSLPLPGWSVLGPDL